MDVDMSLDDIIQKKKIRINNSKKGGGFKGRQQLRQNNRKTLQTNFKANENFNLKTRRGLNKMRGFPNGNSPMRGKIKNSQLKKPSQIFDARLKIIQKTRQKITDAREKLVEKAKLGGDARLKLKMKFMSRQHQNLDPPLILRSVNPSIVNPTISIEEDSDEEMSGTSLMLGRTIDNRIKCNDNELARYDTMLTDFNESMHWSSSRPVNSRLNPLPGTLKIHLQNERISNPWNYQTPASSAILDRQEPSLQRTFGIGGLAYQNDEEQFRNYRTSRMSQEMKARLDTPAAPLSRSMGVLSQTTSGASQPVGHRIVVSNLQASVTHEDIKELFEDIGPLIASHVVRPGTAEVIYVNQKDAVAAVDAYHNRQLDGQPMKCLLVPARNPPTTTSARTGVKYPSSTKSAVVPDLSAIHKALFNK